MSPLVVFILFFVFLLIAIPISVSLGLVAVLPGVFDPSFTASASYVIRSMFGGIDSFPLLAVPMFILSGIIMARGGISKRLFRSLFIFHWKTYSRSAMCSSNNLSVLWSNLWFRNCHSCRSWQYDNSSVSRAWLR